MIIEKKTQQKELTVVPGSESMTATAVDAFEVTLRAIVYLLPAAFDDKIVSKGPYGLV